jgi:phage-related minor tail protein
MANKALKGLTIKIGGDTSELLDSLNDVEKKGASLSKELGEINKLLKMDPSNTQLLAQKQKVLADSVDNTRKKLDTLKEAEKQVQEQFERGEVSEEQVRALQREIVKTEGTLKSYERAVGETADQLKELADGADEAADELEKVGDDAEDSGDGFTVAKGAAAEFIGNGLTSLVDAAKNAIGSILELAESTREYRTELSKLETAASVAGASADYIKDKWHDMGAVLGDEGAVAEGLNNLMAAGFTTEKEMDAITQHLEGAAIKWKDTLKFEGLADGLQETLATGAAVGSFGEMLERSGVNLDTFNEGLAKCKTEAEQQDYVLQQLSKLGLADVSKAYREQNADLIETNKANAEYADTQAELGAALEPLTKKFTELKTKALQWLIEDGLPVIKSGFDWLKNNIPTVAAVVSGLTVAMLAQKVANLANKAALEGMTIAQYASKIAQDGLNKALKANAIGLIITGVTLLVAAFIHLWNNCEGFRNFWIGLWDGIKKAVKAVVDWFVKAWDNTVSWLKKNWKALLLFITNPLAGIFKYLYDNFEGFRNVVDNVVSAVKGFFVDLWNGIVSAYHTVIDPWIEIIKRISVIVYDSVIKPVLDFFAKLWAGIVEGATAAWNWVAGIFKKAATWYYNTVIKPIKDLFVGMWDGLKNGASAAWEGIKSVFSKVGDFFGDIFSKAWQKVKTVFSVGGKIFDGIKDGIVSAFKTVVNAIIRGINKVVKLPFQGLNTILDEIHNVEIVGVKPFDWLTWRAPIPKIPELAEGGVLEKGQVGLLEGDGAEAVVPLEKNTHWLEKVAEKLSRFLVDDLDGLGLERSIRASVSTISPAVVALDGLSSKLDSILTAIENGQVLTIDGEALVGATANAMDNALGRRRALAARGAL